MTSETRRKKTAREVSELHFFRVLQGSVTCWHRPTPIQIEQLATSTPCSLVVTCQGSGESPGDIRTACKAHGLKWVWVKMTGANQALMGATHFQQPVLLGLASVRESLQQGEHVFVHCAAGIHRTGFFLYALLRICGLSAEETLAAIETIRHVTAVQAGAHRFELAETLAQRMLAQGVPLSQLHNPGFTLRISLHETSSGSALLSVTLIGEHSEQALRQAVELPAEAHERLPRKAISAMPGDLQVVETSSVTEADELLCSLVRAQSSGPFIPEVKVGTRVLLEAFYPKLAELVYSQADPSSM